MRLGSWELEGELGRGGFGRVYRARHAATGAVRAVKVLEGAGDPETLARFEREAQALARVGADVAVAVHEVGRDRGRTFYVMDLLQGGSLASRLEARRPWPWREAVSLVARLARAVERCHASGIVHRDLKAENVLFDERGEPRLADFGSARDLGAATLTATGATPGTPACMAPEQLDGARGDERSDVYALGVLLHELVTGARPHEGKSWRELLVQANRGLPAPVARAAQAPASLDRVLARALEPLPAKRTSTAASLAQELETLASADSQQPGAKPRTLALAAAGLAAAVVLVLVGALARRGDRSDPPALDESPPSRARPTPPPPGETDLATLEPAALEERLVALAGSIDGRTRLAGLARRAALLPPEPVRRALEREPRSRELSVLEAVASILTGTAPARAASLARMRRDREGQKLSVFGDGSDLILAAIESDALAARVEAPGAGFAELDSPPLETALKALGGKPALLAAAVAPLATACRNDVVNQGLAPAQLKRFLHRVPLEEHAEALPTEVAIAVLSEIDWTSRRGRQDETRHAVELLLRDARLVRDRDPLLAAVAILRCIEWDPDGRLEALEATLVDAEQRAEVALKGPDDARLMRVRALHARWRGTLAVRGVLDAGRAQRGEALARAVAPLRAVVEGTSTSLDPREGHSRATELVAVLLALGRRAEAERWRHALGPGNPIESLLDETATPSSVAAAARPASSSSDRFLAGTAAGLLAKTGTPITRDALWTGEMEAFSQLAGYAYDGRFPAPR